MLQRPGPRVWLLLLLTIGCTPYIGLKLLWIVGVDIGVRDSGLMGSPLYRVANIVTLVLDVALVLIVVALTGKYRRARWLVPPSVIGLGLLLPVVVGAPTLAIVGLFGSDAAADTGLASWVYAVVYSGFTLQFLVLAGATAVGLRRLGIAGPAAPPEDATIAGPAAPPEDATTAGPAALPEDATTAGPAALPEDAAIAGRRTGLTVLAVCTGAVYLAGLVGWITGASIGLPDGQPLSTSGRAFDVVLLLLAVAAAAAAVTPGRSGTPSPARLMWAVVTATSVWTWALYLLLVAGAGPTGTDAAGVVIRLSGATAGLVLAGRAGRPLLQRIRSPGRPPRRTRGTPAPPRSAAGTPDPAGSDPTR